jgi:hypothetical protein
MFISHSFFSFEFKFQLFTHYIFFFTLTTSFQNSNSTHFLLHPTSLYVLHFSHQPFNFILSNESNFFFLQNHQNCSSQNPRVESFLFLLYQFLIHLFSSFYVYCLITLAYKLLYFSFYVYNYFLTSLLCTIFFSTGTIYALIV